MNESVTQAIQTLGFPVVATIAVSVFAWKMYKDYREDMKEIVRVFRKTMSNRDNQAKVRQKESHIFHTKVVDRLEGIENGQNKMSTILGKMVK